jgi:hypothetical protein
MDARLEVGLAVFVVLLIVYVSARQSRKLAESILSSYWTSSTGAVLFATGGRGVLGSKIVYQASEKSPTVETPGYFSVGWVAASLLAFAGSEPIFFTIPPIAMGPEGEAGTYGELSVGAGMITVKSSKGDVVGRFFRSPNAAATANAALAAEDVEL